MVTHDLGLETLVWSTKVVLQWIKNRLIGDFVLTTPLTVGAAKKNHCCCILKASGYHTFYSGCISYLTS